MDGGCLEVGDVEQPSEEVKTDEIIEEKPLTD